MADLTISKAFDRMPHGKLLIQWGMMGLSRKTVCGSLAKEGMNTSDGNDQAGGGDCLRSCSRNNLGSDSALIFSVCPCDGM